MSNYEHLKQIKQKKNFSKEIEDIKENQMGNIKLKNAITKKKNIRGLNHSLEMTEDRISVRSTEFTQLE